MHRHILLLTGWLACATAVCAQMDQPEPAVRTPAKAERKDPGFFHRPKMKTPDAQLAYARQLAAEGSRRAARKQFDALVHAWHGAPEAVEAQMTVARMLEEDRKLYKAFEQYQYLFEYFQGRFPYTDVLEREFAIAHHLITTPHRFMFLFKTSESPERVLPLFQKILQNAPAWQRAPEVEFYVGRLLEETGEEDQAAAAYERVQFVYPKGEFTAPAALQRALVLSALAAKRPRDETSLRNALSALAVFVRDYPDDPRKDEARAKLNELQEKLARMAFDRAVFYDRMARKPKAALIAYREFAEQFPYSSLAAQAAERVRAIEKEQAP